MDGILAVFEHVAIRAQNSANSAQLGPNLAQVGGNWHPNQCFLVLYVHTLIHEVVVLRDG